ncbi:metallophosphoesterase [Actinomycetospora sp. NBRC 106378]|uniref:metallophosphoesterase family protein n=1 Tax=Actinomycetospora sp. NBRC 106378 TaxID=3032208 RepID=UPI0024A02A1D|nr:metallophosphoesterase [Actinomycetospora sp. NBRC 106378]GLZ51495.1 DNA repair exonuclease [Actinomycetospora sp. NBRC 106378]
MRFVHTADWQLGMTRRFLGAGRVGQAVGEAQARFAQARLDAVAALGRVAADEGAAFVVVCGDVFESNLVGPDVVGRACEALRSFTVPVLLLPGNHDPADASLVMRRADFTRRCPPHVTVLDTPGVHEVAPGIEVVAAPWATKRPLSDLVGDRLRALEPAPEGVVRVLAGHGAVDVLSPDEQNPAVIRTAECRAALADGRVHYVALGDRHSTWQLHGEPRIAYSGAPEVTSHEETDPGNVLVVDVGADGAASVRPVRVGRWTFAREHAVVDTDDDLAALDARLDALDAPERTALRLAVEGTVTLRQRARLDEVTEAHAPVFAALEVDTTAVATRPDDADVEALGLTGFAAEAARELADAARDAADPAALDALALLHRLAVAR